MSNFLRLFCRETGNGIQSDEGSGSANVTAELSRGVADLAAAGFNLLVVCTNQHVHLNAYGVWRLASISTSELVAGGSQLLTSEARLCGAWLNSQLTQLIILSRDKQHYHLHRWNTTPLQTHKAKARLFALQFVTILQLRNVSSNKFDVLYEQIYNHTDVVT